VLELELEAARVSEGIAEPASVEGSGLALLPNAPLMLKCLFEEAALKLLERCLLLRMSSLSCSLDASHA